MVHSTNPLAFAALSLDHTDQHTYFTCCMFAMQGTGNISVVCILFSLSNKPFTVSLFNRGCIHNVRVTTYAAYHNAVGDCAVEKIKSHGQLNKTQVVKKNL